MKIDSDDILNRKNGGQPHYIIGRGRRNDYRELPNVVQGM